MNKEKLLVGFVVFFLLFLWSSGYSAISLALQSFSPEGLALFRFLIASTILLAIAIVKKYPLPKINDIPIIVLCGFLGIAFYNIAVSTGQKTVSAGVASVLFNIYPIFAAILSSLLLKENINIIKWLGIFTSFAGISFIALGGNESFSLSSGALFIILGALSVSLFDVTQKKFNEKIYSYATICIYYLVRYNFTLHFHA